MWGREGGDAMCGEGVLGKMLRGYMYVKREGCVSEGIGGGC